MDKTKIPRQFSLTEFESSSQGMVNKNTATYVNTHDIFWGSQIKEKAHTFESIKNTIERGSLRAKRSLSHEYFNLNGFYRQLIMHYGTLLKNIGILIPNPSYGKSLQEAPIAKRYRGALNLIEKMELEKTLTELSIKVLLDGVYYGVVHTLTKKDFTLMDLPIEYCKVQYQDSKNRDIIEFNTAYFDSIRDGQIRKKALQAYPDFISKHYYATKETRGLSSWMFIPVELGVSFQLFDENPYFLPLIPITLQYDDAVEREAEKEREEIKKVLIQKIPHLNDGTLVFEPDEAEIMHEGTVGMLSTSNPNLSVLTTYGDVSIEQTKTTGNVTRKTLDQMTTHLYANAGISPELFAATGASGLQLSLQYDTSIMMILGKKYSSFVSKVVDSLYGNTQLSFKYTILPITEYNMEDYITNSFKLAQSGYSLLLPAIAQGVSQRDLMNLKDLENNLLDLPVVLKPSQSAYTQSKDVTEEGGRPSLDNKDKTEKTLENEKSLDKGGD